MVYCLKHFIPFLILPYPTATPLFIAAYLLLVFLSVKPCVYCTLLLTLLFTSTCYTHLAPSPPDTSPTPPLAIGTTTTAPVALNSSLALLSIPLTAPDSPRCWCDLNSFHPFDPVLVGYRRQGALLAAQADVEKAAKAAEDAAVTAAAAVAATAAATEDGCEQVDPQEEPAVVEAGESWMQWAGSLWHNHTSSERAEAAARLEQQTKEAAESEALLLAAIQAKKAEQEAADEARRNRWWDPEEKRLHLTTMGGAGFVLDFGWGRSETVVRRDLERAMARRRS